MKPNYAILFLFSLLQPSNWYVMHVCIIDVTTYYYIIRMLYLSLISRHLSEHGVNSYPLFEILEISMINFGEIHTSVINPK
jgi:hypothetical protein